MSLATTCELRAWWSVATKTKIVDAAASGLQRRTEDAEAWSADNVEAWSAAAVRRRDISGGRRRSAVEESMSSKSVTPRKGDLTFDDDPVDLVPHCFCWWSRRPKKHCSPLPTALVARTVSKKRTSYLRAWWPHAPRAARDNGGAAAVSVVRHPRDANVR